MCKWISIKDSVPDLYEYCQVVDNKGVISYAVYVVDSEWDGTRDENYFAELDGVRFKDGKYSCDGLIGGEVLNVTHYYMMPLEVDYD